MSDEGLRALERAVEAGDAGARVRLAREYERLGRRDDAVGALLPGASDPGVRQALGALPAWRDLRVLHSTPGFVDVPSPASAPATAWQAALGPSRYPGELLASPLGVVATATEHGHVLDATTGAVRARVHVGNPGQTGFGTPTGPKAIRGDVVLARAGGYRLRAHDLWTGELLHDTRYGADWSLAGDLVVECTHRRTGRGYRSAFVARRLADPRRAPEPAWRLELDHGDLGRLVAAVGAVAALQITVTNEVHVVDARTGEARFRAKGNVIASDVGGVFLENTSGLRHLDAAGRATWTVTKKVGQVDAVGPDLVLTRVHNSSADPLVGLDRRTGEERWRRQLPNVRATALLRDAVHVLGADWLASLDPATGETRWVVRDLPGAVAYAPLGRRAFVLFRNGRVVCLRAAP